MSKNEQKEHLLPFHRESSDDDHSELDGPYGRRPIERPLKSTGSVILSIIMVMSICLNCGLVIAYWRARTQMFLCPSEYSKPSWEVWKSLYLVNTVAGLGLTTKATYWQQTEYSDHNRTISDAAWEALDTSPIMISLDQTYSRQHDLADSIPFPWDQSRGLYHVKAFHHIHCLVSISSDGGRIMENY